MAITRNTRGIIVGKSSDYVVPTVRIACKEDVYDFDADKVPPSVKIGDWVACRINDSGDIETVSQAKIKPMETRIDESTGRVQAFSYCTVPIGHCATRDDYNGPQNGKVWSPYLGYASSRDEVMFGMREEILYEAWFDYNDMRNEGDPIWNLSIVGEAIIDPAKLILLKDTPWKLAAASGMIPEAVTTMSGKLLADTTKIDGFHTGMIIALIKKPDAGVIVYSRTNGVVSIDKMKHQKYVANQLKIGIMVKFRELTDPISGKKYHEIKEVVNATRLDIVFEVKTDEYYSCITMLTQIGIDDDLLKEETTGNLKLLCDYGEINVSRENFAKQMKGVLLDRNDLVRAKENEKELPIWIRYVPVSNTWSLIKIDSNWDL